MLGAIYAEAWITFCKSSGTLAWDRFIYLIQWTVCFLSQRLRQWLSLCAGLSHKMCCRARGQSKFSLPWAPRLSKVVLKCMDHILKVIFLRETRVHFTNISPKIDLAQKTAFPAFIGHKILYTPPLEGDCLEEGRRTTCLHIHTPQHALGAYISSPWCIGGPIMLRNKHSWTRPLSWNILFTANKRTWHAQPKNNTLWHELLRNNSLRIIFVQFWSMLQPQNLREGKRERLC